VTENKSSDFAARLPELLSPALQWAEEQSSAILRDGQPLNARGLALACAIGVAYPDRIRALTVPHIPAPDDPELKQLALGANAAVRPKCKKFIELCHGPASADNIEYYQ
jgi:hypothetical protein